MREDHIDRHVADAVGAHVLLQKTEQLENVWLLNSGVDDLLGETRQMACEPRTDTATSGILIWSSRDQCEEFPET
jgi:hypothetical protein